MIVVDASALVDALLPTRPAPPLSERILIPDQTLHAPHLIDLEIAQVLRRYARTGQVSIERCRAALTDLGELPLMRHPHGLFLARIWDLRDTLTAYDAAYVALAEALDAPLLTRDQRLANSVGHLVCVEVV
jgi:predicted nucleic acid-binding protein